MSQRDLKGLFSALLVSFDEQGNINEKGLRQIIRYNIDVNHMDGLYVGGSTGENFMLSTDEKKRIFEIAKDEAKDALTLIAQVGSVNLKESVELAKFVTDLGYDAISAVTPFYYKFTLAWPWARWPACSSWAHSASAPMPKAHSSASSVLRPSSCI